MAVGGITDVATQNGVSDSNYMTSTRMHGGGTTDGAIVTIATNGTETATDITSVSVTDITNSEPTGGVSVNYQCICLLVASIILSLLYV